MQFRIRVHASALCCFLTLWNVSVLSKRVETPLSDLEILLDDDNSDVFLQQIAWNVEALNLFITKFYPLVPAPNTIYEQGRRPWRNLRKKMMILVKNAYEDIREQEDHTRPNQILDLQMRLKEGGLGDNEKTKGKLVYIKNRLKSIPEDLQALVEDTGTIKKGDPLSVIYWLFDVKESSVPKTSLVSWNTDSPTKIVAQLQDVRYNLAFIHETLKENNFYIFLTSYNQYGESYGEELFVELIGLAEKYSQRLADIIEIIGKLMLTKSWRKVYESVGARFQRKPAEILASKQDPGLPQRLQTPLDTNIAQKQKPQAPFDTNIAPRADSIDDLDVPEEKTDVQVPQININML